tara:strand:+ start:470 stop:676 length:207 start_codon:yes stop_codon:yes gene_type:complete
MRLRYQKGDVIKTRYGLATVLGSNWITVCDGWHPDKRRTEEELRILINDGSIKTCYAEHVEGPIIRDE